MARVSANALRSWECPKKSGIRIREVLNTTTGATFGASYLVTVPAKITGKLRERKQFKERAEAEEHAEKAFSGFKKQGQDFFALSETERREVAASLPLLREHGVSITEAVRFAVKHLRPENKTKSLADVVTELVASKAQRFERGDLRERSYRDFKHRAGKFSEGFTGRIASEITDAEIKAWLVGLGVGPRSNANYLATIAELFRFATQRRYVAFSPLDRFTDVDRKELCGRGAIAREPAILTPDEAERLLRVAKENPDLGLLAPVVLALFCGLRTEEIKRLDWDSVRLGETPPIVTVGAKIAKKRRIRNVEIPPNAGAWLSLVTDRTGQVTHNAHFNDYQKRFKKLLALAKFTRWGNNAMRHSFGSYHYALHGNPLETARLLGHKASDQVLFDHYRALATKTQAEAFFAIRPPAEAGKIVRFA